MKGILSGLEAIIEGIKMAFTFIGTIFKTLGLAIGYVVTIVQMSLDLALTLPTWLQAFAIITITISVIYFLIGRNAGKSD